MDRVEDYIGKKGVGGGSYELVHDREVWRAFKRK